MCCSISLAATFSSRPNETAADSCSPRRSFSEGGTLVRSRFPAVLRESKDMGDKSPKTKNKQAAQKQAKADSAAKQKNDNRAAKQVVKPKR